MGETALEEAAKNNNSQSYEIVLIKIKRFLLCLTMT